MKKINYRDINLYFLVLFIILLIANSWFFYFGYVENFEVYAISSIFLFIILFSLVKGITSGLITSLITIFIYSSYLMLRQFVLPWKKDITLEEIFWVS